MSGPGSSGKFTVVASTRREWPALDKQRILAEAAEPGANISEVARRTGVAQSLLYRWRKDAAVAAQRAVTFVPIAISAPSTIEPATVIAPPASDPSSNTEIEIILANGRRVRARAGIDATALARIVRALEAAA